MIGITYYELLGLKEDASTQEIKRVYRTCQKKLHPDVAGQEMTHFSKLINEAYGVLKDEELRKNYDWKLNKARNGSDEDFNYEEYTSNETTQETNQSYEEYSRTDEEEKTSYSYSSSSFFDDECDYTFTNAYPGSTQFNRHNEENSDDIGFGFVRENFNQKTYADGPTCSMHVYSNTNLNFSHAIRNFFGVFGAFCECSCRCFYQYAKIPLLFIAIWVVAGMFFEGLNVFGTLRQTLDPSVPILPALYQQMIVLYHSNEFYFSFTRLLIFFVEKGVVFLILFRILQTVFYMMDSFLDFFDVKA